MATSIIGEIKMVRLELPFPVSVNGVWRMGRNRRTGKRIVYRSKPYISWLKDATVQWLIQKPKGPFKTIEGAFDVEIRLSRPDRRRRDADNYHKVVTDFAQRAGIIKDDCNIRKTSTSWVTDEEAPMGMVLIITPVNS
jgi:Holliday junction resolvase RusA-like endonuclease